MFEAEKINVESLYKENRLLMSALFEIHGDNVNSASLFCLDNGIDLDDRNKIILLLNKYSDFHERCDIEFWREVLLERISNSNLSNLTDREFQKMIDMFWNTYVL